MEKQKLRYKPRVVYFLNTKMGHPQKSYYWVGYSNEETQIDDELEFDDTMKASKLFGNIAGLGAGAIVVSVVFVIVLASFAQALFPFLKSGQNDYGGGTPFIAILLGMVVIFLIKVALEKTPNKRTLYGFDKESILLCKPSKKLIIRYKSIKSIEINGKDIIIKTKKGSREFVLEGVENVTGVHTLLEQLVQNIHKID
ncbi:MAG: hypothetical protein GY810_09635 [Aureispira sp.]|nr:hypothetical protein [Aureispira sp.]